MTDKFSITAGARWFDVEQTKEYLVDNPGGRRTPAIPNLDGEATGRKGCLVPDAALQPGL